MPLATTTRFVNNRGIDTAFEVAGSGPAMVLGHSFLCSRLMEIEATGHISAVEQPEAVTAAMREFLDTLGNAP